MRVPGIEQLKRGENSKTYRVKGNIVKVSGSTALGREGRNLQFLEDQGYLRCPLLSFSLPGISLLVQQEVGAEDVEFEELSAEKLESLQELVTELFSLEVEGYNDFFNEENPEAVATRDYFESKVEERQKDLKIYRNTVEEPDRRLVSLCEKGLEKIKEVPDIDLSLHLCHLDMVNNIRKEKDGVRLIDWEHLRPELPEYSYVVECRRGRLEKQQRKKMEEIHASALDRELFLGELREHVWTAFLLHDVLWAATRAAETGEDSYRSKLRDRRKRLKHYIENGEILMEKMYHGR